MKKLLEKIPPKTLGIFALLFAIFLWGPAPVIIKLTLEEVPEISLGFLRNFIAVSALFLLFFKKGYFSIQRQDLPLFILAGLLGSALNTILFLFGIQSTSAISAQTIFTAAPILTALLAYFILKERITLVQFFGVFFGLAGAVIVATRDFLETGILSLGNLQGSVLVVLAMISWVLYILISKRLSFRYSPITITSFSFLVGFVVFIPLFIGENLKGFGWISEVTSLGIFGILYQGLFAGVLAVLVYQIGLKLTSAFTAGVVLYLNLVITTVFAVPILGEKITFPFLVGAALVILGSFISTQFEFVKNHIQKRIRGRI